MELKRVLVVEDEAIVALNLQTQLERLGYQVVDVVGSGDAAVRRARALRPDVVLMDIELEGEMDGVDAATEIRSSLDIPLVYITAYADDATLQRAKLTEPFGYIIKPFDERTLRTNIEMATYKHSMEKELKSSQQWFLKALNSIGDAVIATDNSGSIKFMNAGAERLTGCSLEEAAGRPWTEIFNIIDEETHRRCVDALEKARKSGGVVPLSKSGLLIARDRTEYIVGNSSAPILDSDNNIIGAILVFHDLSQRRVIEQEMLRIQRLESLSVFAGAMAHDLHDIVQTIISCIAQVKSLPPEDPAREEKLDKAGRAAAWASKYVQQLQTFSQDVPPVIEHAEIGPIIRETVDFALKGSFVSHELDLPEDLWHVDVDGSQLHRAITNLISNCDQAMPNGGVIRIGVSNTVLDANANLPLDAGDYVLISVDDEAEDLAEDMMPKIFDPYVSTGRRWSGLGMAQAHSIVTRHGGLITVESTPGMGTSFHVYLPASTAG